MTWRNSENTRRLIALISAAGRPMTTVELAERLGLSGTTILMHLAAARDRKSVARVGGGSAAAWATPGVAAAAKLALREAARLRRLRRVAKPPKPDRDAPIRPWRSTWEPMTEAPGPNSVFALGGG